MSIQRRRGQKAVIYPEKRTVNARGERVLVPDWDNGRAVRVAVIPQRSAKAEVPGQVDIDVVSMIVRHDLESFGTWACVEWRGRLYDLAAPPAYHHGTRHVRHYTVDLRARPHEGAASG